jgi:hypothetical protein
MRDVFPESSQVLPTCLLLFSLMCWVLHGALACAPVDRIALSTFSEHLDTAVNGWPGAENYSGDCCRWLSVGCSLFGAEELRVVSLDLAGRVLTGVVSSRLAGLDELRVLNLSRNSLRGTMLSELLRMQ